MKIIFTATGHSKGPAGHQSSIQSVSKCRLHHCEKNSTEIVANTVLDKNKHFSLVLVVFTDEQLFSIFNAFQIKIKLMNISPHVNIFTVVLCSAFQ